MCSLYSLRWQQLYCHTTASKKGRKPTPFRNRKGIKRQFKFDKNFENDPIFNFEKLVCHHWQREVGPVINPPFKLKRRSLSAAYSLTTHSLLKLSLIFYTCNLENTLCHHFWNAYRSAATSLDTTFDFNHRVDMIIKEMTVALNPKKMSQNSKRVVDKHTQSRPNYYVVYHNLFLKALHMLWPLCWQELSTSKINVKKSDRLKNPSKNRFCFIS